MIKIKDEEITQLKSEIGLLEVNNEAGNSRRDSASPLRHNRSSSGNRNSQSAKSNRNELYSKADNLEDQLQQMNEQTLEDQVKALIKDNYDLKM